MRRTTIQKSFYSEAKDGLAELQEYRWDCLVCAAKAEKLIGKPFKVYESNRHGVTSGMGTHLKISHHITAESHQRRLMGYSNRTGTFTENDAWRGEPKHQARLSASEATRRWVVKTRQPFSVVDTPEFQEMFIAYGTHCRYKNRCTLRNHIYDDFATRRVALRQELLYDCTSISFTLDLWTAPNRVPIFAIFGHWWNNIFEEREEVLEFIEVKGSHDGPTLARITEDLVDELDIRSKLFAFCGDNASNNGTLCDSLFEALKKTHTDRATSTSAKPYMQFHGRQSWIHCYAHIIALVCTDMLSHLKAGTAHDAKQLLDGWEKQSQGKSYTIPGDASRSSIAKIRLLNLWMLRSSGREQDWNGMAKCTNRRPIYDVDTRWNSAFDMIAQFLELRQEYEDFVDDHPATKCLFPSDKEIVALQQLAFVLAPFKKMTLKVSEDQPSLARTLEGYWDLDDLITKIRHGDGDYSHLDQTLRDAFKVGYKKYVKYAEMLDESPMTYAAHILDPRCRTTMIRDMMPVKAEKVLDTVREYFLENWPRLAIVENPVVTGDLATASRPEGTSIAQWRGMLARRDKQIADSIVQATSELDRWYSTIALQWDKDTNNNPDFLPMWWKANHKDWPLLAGVARHLLPCCSSEVDVERLFSGCCDEYGIRRHSLKASTVRVLTLLRSQYQSEDEIDTKLVASAMELDIVSTMRNSILWRPDRFDGHVEGKNSLAYCLLV